MSKEVLTADPNIDAMETELVEATEAPKVKKEKKVREPKIGPNQIGASEIAGELGVNPRDLRNFLRKHFRDMSTSKGQTYVWDRGSKEVQDIIDAFKAAKSAPKAPRAPKAEKATEASVPAPVKAAPQVDLDDLDMEDEEV